MFENLVKLSEHLLVNSVRIDHVMAEKMLPEFDEWVNLLLRCHAVIEQKRL